MGQEVGRLRKESDNGDLVWYFAYGSNLYIPQMLARVGEWEVSKKAQVNGWKLVFNVNSPRWGGGTANIIKTNKPTDVVHGAIYLLSRQKVEALTKYERKGPKEIIVESEGKKVKAKAYVFSEDKPRLKPVPLYVETIIKGLRQHSYSEDVIEALRAYGEKNVRFSLFSKESFEVSDPVALVEAYCFQSDFYANYDLLKRKRKRNISDVNEIGARIEEDHLSKCEAIVEAHKDLPVLGLSLDAFLRLDDNTRRDKIQGLGALVKELVDLKGIGLSKATKILHTIHPEIIPIIDRNLQETYRKLNPQWKFGNWDQLLSDYYDNFLVENTYQNLCVVHESVSHLGLTKLRIFDILWWSYLKAKKLRDKHNVNWTTILEHKE